MTGIPKFYPKITKPFFYFKYFVKYYKICQEKSFFGWKWLKIVFGKSFIYLNQIFADLEGKNIWTEFGNYGHSVF